MADIEDVCDSKKSDFMSAGSSIITSINYKVAILLLFISFIIFSDLFVDSVLAPIPEAVIAGQVTTKGTLIQIIFLIIGYIASDLSVKYELIWPTNAPRVACVIR